MNHEQFNNFLQEKLAVTKQVLGTKADEYASISDRFHNFEQGKYFLDVEKPSTVGWAYMTKHLVSCQDIVHKEEDGVQTPISQINEKFGDAINYLFLIWAMLSES